MSTFKPGSVASRFVSQTELTEAQKQREADMKAAYARMGQEPPPQQEEQEYDPRSLYERLQAQKDAKQEKMDEMFSLGNQFRGLDEGESEFLADVQAERREEERKKRLEEEQELEQFRRAALAREGSPNPPALLSTSASTTSGKPPSLSNAGRPPSKSSSSTVSPSMHVTPKAKGKRKRDGLLGVVKRKPHPSKTSLHDAPPAQSKPIADTATATFPVAPPERPKEGPIVPAPEDDASSTSIEEVDLGKRRKINES